MNWLCSIAAINFRRQAIHPLLNEPKPVSAVVVPGGLTKPACATCVHWQGTAEAYMGDCSCEESYQTRTPFDYYCDSWDQRTAG